MEYELNALEEKMKSVPADVRNAITSAEVGKKLQEVGKKHGLHIDQLDELFDETGLVMLGLTKPNNYVENVSERLDVSREEANKIAQDINAAIFKPIRESLKKIHSETQPPAPNSELPTVKPPPVVPTEAAKSEVSSEERAAILSREDILREIEDLDEAPHVEPSVKTPEPAAKEVPAAVTAEPRKAEEKPPIVVPAPKPSPVSSLGETEKMLELGELHQEKLEKVVKSPVEEVKITDKDRVKEKGSLYAQGDPYREPTG